MDAPHIYALIVEFIGTLGVPTAIAAFLLWERRTTTKEFTKALKSLTKAVDILTITLDHPATYRATESGVETLRAH